MNLSRARWLDRWIGVPACVLLSLVHRCRNLLPRRPVDPRSILLIQISEMGSVLLSHSMLMEIKHRYPKAELHFLIFGKNRDCLQVLDQVRLQNVIALEHRSLPGFLWSALTAIARIRRIGIDTVIDLEHFSRISAIFAASSGAENRVGFHRHRMEGLYRGSFWTQPVFYNPYLHMSHNYANLARALLDGSGTPLVKVECGRALPLPPVLPPDDERRRRAEELLSQSCPGRSTNSKIVLLNPSGGDLPIRAWPLESYCELTTRLLRRPGIWVGVIGLKRDRRLYSEMAARIGSSRFFDLTGKTLHVLDLIEVFNVCDVLVTADSGPAHFSSLSSIHAVVIFGPETPLLYRPLGENHTCLFAGLTCSPCLSAYNHRETPCDGNNLCVQQFSPAVVERIVLERLRTEE